MSLSKGERSFLILFVDSLDHQRLALQEAINANIENCRLIEAKSFDQAENLIRETIPPFDLAIIDEDLGQVIKGKKGIKLKEKICERNRYAKVITVSARPSTKTTLLLDGSIEATSRISKIDKTYTQTLISEIKQDLYRPDVRASLKQQHKALRSAMEDFNSHSQEWISQYGGNFVLVSRNGVIGVAEDSSKMKEILNNYNPNERKDMAVLKIPLG